MRRLGGTFVGLWLVVSCGDDGTPAGDTEPTGASTSTAVGSSGDTGDLSMSSGMPPATTEPATTEPATTDPDTSTGPAAACGDGVAEGDEDCDGDDLGDWTCEKQGFEGGSLACDADCELDTRACFFFLCGNGTIEGDEICDIGTTGAETCQTQGFESGTLGCDATCRGFDTSGCGVCGNDVVDGDEVCDGVELAGEDCESQGFDHGDLACNVTCDGFETTACGLCGDGAVGGSESCDGADLGGATCGTLSLGGGNLACTAGACTFDTSGCDIPGGSLVTVRQTDGMLRAYNLVTGQFVDIGATGLVPILMGLAYDPTTGTLWMVDGINSVSVYTVDVMTGVATLVGQHGQLQLSSAAFSTATSSLHTAGGIFFPTGFHELDQMTGAATLIGDPGFALEGLTYDITRDQIVGVDCGNTGNFYEIDPLTGLSTLLATPGFMDLCGLTHEPIGDLYWTIDFSGNLYSYDPNNAYTQTLVTMDPDPHDGLAYIPGLVP